MKKQFTPFKDVINALIINLELTQEEFAAKVGVNQSMVSKWINGIIEPSYHTLQQICYALNADPAEILGLKEF